ncbi:MAG: hypothetical protein ACD_80C00145G0070 [uncultured bacterium (gcode 4)]|uniref:UTP--glucose-1-phosphate uridylyltransferase n=1 Tax=uncultured bacterium (gcode 4) TaxID=1234023 RepID=K1XI74_9BACT|nr:MAG: hypothetical protein ACD_80C00145G0070 [uncultured bacterium (gcode 4)]
MKAVIVAAGFGTRMLPITKTVPKEMLPVGDRPIIQYTIEWLVDAGITDIIMITSHQKKALEDYFDKNYELEDILQKKGKLELLALINKPKTMATYTFVKQLEMLGTGHALMQAQHLISDDYFMVIFADTIYPPEAFVEMMKAFERSSSPIVAIHEVPQKEVYKYGVVKLDGDKVIDFVEKPKVEDAPSNLIWNGAAILPKRIFSLLQNLEADHRSWELNLPDAIKVLLKETPVVGLSLRPYLDTGSLQWRLEANAKFLRDGKLFA